MAKISLKKGGKTVNGKFVANAPKPSSSSSSKKTTSTPAPTTQSQAQTLATLKSSLEKMSADLKAGKVITADTMQNAQKPVALPIAPKPTNPGAINLDQVMGYTVDSKTQSYLPDTAESVNQTSDKLAQDRISQLMSEFDQTRSQESIRLQVDKDARLAQKEQAVSNSTNQLNSIISNRDAQVLALEGAGRGQTTDFIGGEQGRINREAAISALPVQAALAAAQGDLQTAQAHADKLFQVKVADQSARFQFNTSIINAVYDAADKSQQRKLDDIKTKEAQKYQEQQSFLKTQQSLMSQALAQGASSAVVSAINSATTPQEAITAAGQYNGDVLGRQLQQAQLASANRANQPSAAKRDTQFDTSGNLVDMQTGEIISGAGGAQGTDAPQKTLDQTSFLQTTISDALTLVDATGPNLINKGLGNVFVGNTRVKQLNSKLDTLKTNLLTLNSDPALKKFFGPQMSEKDTALLLSAGSTLNAYDNTEAGNKAELERYSDLLNRIQTAIKGKTTTFGIVLTGGDGKQYTLID